MATGSLLRPRSTAMDGHSPRQTARMSVVGRHRMGPAGESRKSLRPRMSIAQARMSVVQGNMRGRRGLPGLNSNFLKPENKRPRCQPWRLPIEKEKFVKVGKRRTAVFDYREFYYFCPACNVSFHDFDEYQSHLIVRELSLQQEEMLDEISRQIKDQNLKRANKEIMNEYSRKHSIMRKSLAPNRRTMSRKVDPDISTFLSQAEELELHLSTLKKKSDYRDENFKFNIREKQKFYDMEEALENAKKAKARLTNYRSKIIVRNVAKMHGVSETKLLV